MSQAKVLVIPLRSLADVLHGRARVANLPGDAEIVAAVASKDGLGLRVHSRTYPVASAGDPLPLVTAVTQRSAA